MNELIVTHSGVKGGDQKHSKQGYARLSVQEGSVSVDVFEGQGITYKRRDKAQVGITLPSGKAWQGTFEQLEKQLFGRAVEPKTQGQ